MSLRDSDSLVMTGAVQDVQVVGAPKQCACLNCGHVITVASGLVTNGQQLSVIGSTQESINCPKCNTAVQLK